MRLPESLWKTWIAERRGICGKGMYSGQEKTIIFCVVNKKEISEAERDGR